MRQLKLSVAMAAIALVACGPQKVDPQLIISPSPRTIDGEGQTTQVRVQTTDEYGKPGTGTVRLTSTHGTLVDGTDIALTDGEGTTTFGCNRADDPECVGSVRLTGTWNGLSINTNITVKPAHIPDGGLGLTATPSSIGVALGQPSTLVASYFLDGVAAPGATIDLASTLGTLTLLDGGAWAPSTTDSLGQVKALLVADVVAGTAVVTATGPDGKTATANVVIFTPDAGLQIESEYPLLTVGFNQTSAITVTHKLGNQIVPGRSIALTTNRGALYELDGGPFVSPALTDSAGQLHAVLGEAEGGTQPGLATITATDTTFNVSETRTVTFSPPDAGVTLTATPTTLYINIGQSSNLLATFSSNGVPAANKPLNVSTNLGQLQYPDGGMFTSPATTDAQGRVALRLVDTGAPGTATVTAVDPESGRQATANVAFNTIGSIAYTGAVCSSVVTPACSIMGIAGSNFNTTASYNFTVRDGAGLPVPNVTVNFSFEPGAPSDTVLTSATGVTNGAGVATAVVNAGNTVGSFRLVASIQSFNASVDVGVRGAKASSRGMSLQCSRFNLPAYRTDGTVLDVAQPPLGWTTTCTVTLLDRRLNPIGTGQKVFLRTEAGGVPSEVSTTPYNPTGGPTANTNEGKATFTFSTVGPLPVDTEPFPALSEAQHFPIARPPEPAFDGGTQIRNPRDGLVTIIAYTQGDEWYDDDSSNNVRDPNEQFFDSPDPFVDSNDDDVPGPGEEKFPSSLDAGFRGLNNVWDQNVSIWTSTKILYTDNASLFVPGTYNVPQTTPVPSQQDVNVIAWDKNYNIISGLASSGAYVSRTGSRGTFQYFPNNFADTYGFSLTQKEETNADGTGDCVLGVTPICTFRTRFTGWFDGNMGYVRVTGATTGTPESNSCTVRLTTLGSPTVSTDAVLTGTMQ